MNPPRCISPGKAGTLCTSCRYSPLNQRHLPTTGRMTPVLTRDGGCRSHSPVAAALTIPSDDLLRSVMGLA